MKSRGFTLIELLVTLSVIAVIATIAFYGLSGAKDPQPVINAQLEFITNFRSLQNSVYQGADGQNYKYLYLDKGGSNNTKYSIYGNDGVQIGQTVNLPSGVKLNFSGLPKLAICVVNPNMTLYDGPVGSSTSPCWNVSCGAGPYFACQSDTGLPGGTFSPVGSAGPASITVDFTRGLVKRSITIEGSRMIINRVYTQ